MDTDIVKKILGRPPKYKTPEELAEKVAEYFVYCVKNPLVYNTYYTEDGIERTTYKPKPFTKIGLALFCGYSSYERLKDLSNREEGFREVITCAESIIYTQKFDYASIGVFQHTIMIRDLELIDKRDVKVSDARKTIDDMFPEDLDEEEGKSES